MKKLIWILILIIFFTFPNNCFAVSVTIDSFPQTINSDSFTVNVSILGASAGTNYLRIDLYKENTANYFGETFNGSNWYSGSDGKQYFPIIIESSKSTVSASLLVRVGTPNSTDYDGQGNYKMRIRRYTNSGSQGSEDANASAVNVSLVLPTPTQTPVPTPTQTPIKTPTPTKSPTPTPTPKPTLITKPSITPKPSLFVSNYPTISVKITKTVLAKSTESVTNKAEKKEKINDKQESQGSKINFAKIFISFGLLILIGCAILIVLKLRKEQK